MAPKQKGKHYSLIISDEELCAKIDQEPEKIKKLIEIIAMYYDGSLLPQEHIKLKIQTQQLKKLEAQNATRKSNPACTKPRFNT